MMNNTAPNKNPLVSAIISTYNSERHIKGKLDDLLQQTIANQLEIIIINSASRQNEEEIIRPYLVHYSNIKYLRTDQRETIYKAWNRGIRMSRGEFITNANTDDRLRCDALEILSNALKSRENVGVVYANQYITDISNQQFGKIKSRKKVARQGYSRIKLFVGYNAGSQSMWRASLHFIDNLWFDETFEVAGDYDFVCRVAEKYDLLHINKVLGLYYKSPGNENKEYQDLLRTNNETCSIQEKYARDYFEKLPVDLKETTLRQLRRYTILPRRVYAAIRVLKGMLFPAKQIPSQLLMCWLQSLLFETMGNIFQAKICCRKYLDCPDAKLLKIQFDHLLHLKAEEQQNG